MENNLLQCPIHRHLLGHLFAFKISDNRVRPLGEVCIEPRPVGLGADHRLAGLIVDFHIDKRKIVPLGDGKDEFQIVSLGGLACMASLSSSPTPPVIYLWLGPTASSWIMKP